VAQGARARYIFQNDECDRGDFPKCNIENKPHSLEKTECRKSCKRNLINGCDRDLLMNLPVNFDAVQNNMLGADLSLCNRDLPPGFASSYQLESDFFNSAIHVFPLILQESELDRKNHKAILKHLEISRISLVPPSFLSFYKTSAQWSFRHLP